MAIEPNIVLTNLAQYIINSWLYNIVNVLCVYIYFINYKFISFNSSGH